MIFTFGRPPSNPKAILVFRSCGLGDFILCMPALRLLRLRYPNSRIIFLTTLSADRNIAAKIASYAGGGANSPWTQLATPHLIDEVITISDVRSFSAIRKARAVLASDRVDFVVQMIDVGTPLKRRLKKVALVAALVGLVPQIGWRIKGALEAGKIPAKDPKIGHHVHGPLHFLKELDGPKAYATSDILFELNPDEVARCWAQDWISKHLSISERLIAIAPGAAHPHKSWPTERFLRLAREMLAHRSDVRIVISGTKEEAAKGAALRALDPERIIDLTGQCSIAQSAALFAHCALVVGNDGGAMHLADAMGATVVSIVPGLEFPVSIEPWNNQHLAVRHPVYCAPCYSFTFCPQGHNQCMLELPFEHVWENCVAALKPKILS